VDQEAILLTDVVSRQELLEDDPFFLQPKRPPKQTSTDSSPSSDENDRAWNLAEHSLVELKGSRVFPLRRGAACRIRPKPDHTPI
jgi:hypothetical protein